MLLQEKYQKSFDFHSLIKVFDNQCLILHQLKHLSEWMMPKEDKYIQYLQNKVIGIKVQYTAWNEECIY